MRQFVLNQIVLQPCVNCIFCCCLILVSLKYTRKMRMSQIELNQFVFQHYIMYIQLLPLLLPFCVVFAQKTLLYCSIKAKKTPKNHTHTHIKIEKNKCYTCIISKKVHVCVDRRNEFSMCVFMTIYTLLIRRFEYNVDYFARLVMFLRNIIIILHVISLI